MPERKRLTLNRLPNLIICVRNGHARVELFNRLDPNGVLAQHLTQLLVPVHNARLVRRGPVEVGRGHSPGSAWT